MYVKEDPRSSLQPAKRAGSERRHEEFFGSQFRLFCDSPPQIEADGEKTWITRGQNFIVAYSECAAGCRLGREDQPDDYALIVPDAETSVTITAGKSVDIPGYSIAFVPPGRSEIDLAAPGRVMRLFSPKAGDLATLAWNASAFTGEHPNVPPFEPWPDPPDGFRVRHYSLDVPDDPKRFGRIFRCTTFMINYLNPRIGPRERTAVSPHHHDDFEQCSLALSGSFTHHLRWPWTTDMTKWKGDEHHFCRSPSICVIPPPAIHTTTAEDEGLERRRLPDERRLTAARAASGRTRPMSTRAIAHKPLTVRGSCSVNYFAASPFGRTWLKTGAPSGCPVRRTASPARPPATVGP